MYQLTMSLIHEDQNPSSDYDVDSCVTHISDSFTASGAAHEYCKKLTAEYGVSWHMGDTSEDVTWHTWADFPGSPGGPAKVHVEVTRITPLEDIDEIVNLLVVKSTFTNAARPSSI